MPHPGEEQLLRYSDGELPARATAQVRSHLKACWQCRAALEEIENTVGACVRYRTNVLQRHLPPPPEPWADIRRSFAVIDASLDRPSLADRLARLLAFPVHHARKWVPVAVALMIAWGLFYRYRLTPSVQAAELLQKAIVAADTHPLKTRRLQVRTKTHSFTRLTGPVQASNSGDRETLNSLKTLFHNANYNWDDPLSARSYAAWRDQLSAKRDEVVEGRDSYRIRTGTDSGELMQATLQLRSQDLQPVEGRFEFRNQEWVEITAMSDEVAPSVNALPSAGVPAPPAHRASPDMPAPGVSEPAASLGDELRVLTALHQVGADLGDPLEVSRTGSAITVSGVGIAPERRAQIQQALAALPRVAVRFTDSAPVASPAEQTAPENPAGADNRQLQARIAEQVGGRAHFEQIAADVLDMTEPMMARVYALRALEEKFPAQLEAQLTSSDLESLRQLQREHNSALRQQIAALEKVLKPLVGSSGSSRYAPQPAFNADTWQPATEELFQSARRVEKLLAVMFGASPAGSLDQQQLPAQLASSLAQLRAKVEAYDRLLVRSER